MGIDRKQGDDDTDAGYSRKYRKEKGAEDFFVQSLHVMTSKKSAYHPDRLGTRGIMLLICSQKVFVRLQHCNLKFISECWGIGVLELLVAKADIF